MSVKAGELTLGNNLKGRLYMRARIFKAAAATAAICTLAGASLVSAQTGTIGTTGPNSNNQITSTANDSIHHKEGKDEGCVV